MKLLLDEHFSPRVSHRLRELRRDVVAAREVAGVSGLADAELLDLAVRERRALVTENVADFVALHGARIVAGRHHFGLVFTSPRRFPRTTRAVGRLVTALDALLLMHVTDEALFDQTWWLGAP